MEFGLERVKEHLGKETAQTAQGICGSILNSVGEFTCEPLVPDGFSLDTERWSLAVATA